MEPRPSGFNYNPEQLPVPGQGPERAPNPELRPEYSTERVEQKHEGAPGTEMSRTPQVLPPVALPQTPTPVVDDPAQTSTSTTPSTANDDDLIEKEWVDKAKKIVLETKDDPYRREQEVGKLQADYMKKRYGKELGAS